MGLHYLRRCLRAWCRPRPEEARYRTFTASAMPAPRFQLTTVEPFAVKR